MRDPDDHIRRADPDDHMRRVVIDAELKIERNKRRVGRPRFFWLQNTMKRAHKLVRKTNGRGKVQLDIETVCTVKKLPKQQQNGTTLSR